MDSVTHAVTGAVTYLAFKNRPKTAWAIPLAMLAASFPDIDVLLGRVPLDFLILHRGITHALVVMPFMAAFLTLTMYVMWSKKTSGAWPLYKVYLLALLLLTTHIWLDMGTTYGTMIFMPFSDYRVRLNGLFIIDPFLTVPLILALIFARKNQLLMLFAAAWVFIHPSIMIGERIALENKWQKEIVSTRPKADPESVVVLPDVFAPFNWRVLYKEKASVSQQALNIFGKAHGTIENYPLANKSLVADSSAADKYCKTFFNFTILPVQKLISKAEDGSTELQFYDLRFDSLVPFARKIMAMRNEGKPPFQLFLQLDGQGKPIATKLLVSALYKGASYEPIVPNN